MSHIIKIKRLYNVPLIERIENLIFYSPDGCWYWFGEMSEGYRARIGINGKTRPVSRVIYELLKGEIPNGLLVCHTCDNGLCVNPDHLFLGTHKDNSIDMVKKGRCGAPRGSKSGKSKLTEDQVVEMRSLKGTMTFREIGKRFGITGAQTGAILTGKAWKHVL